MDQLIPVINKLQDVFNAIGGDAIDLPQIVVIGSQSSGKSSVLENIVGRDFLPRGQGIVTRRPLVLQLINLPASSGGSSSRGDKDKEDSRFKEWGEFLHKPNEIFYDFQEIREEIQRETDRLSGKNKGISQQPINLKIYSPHVLNLTLVDLPGITRVPVGDQPSDIEQQIRRMILAFIEKPNAIVLAVTAANTDLANSDALQLAQEVDPEGNRTIGVITKIDLMDRGTDALDVLLGRVIPLRLGYIGVVNRSQQDIIKNKSIRHALRDEAEYFATHPLYRDIAARCGTPHLAKTLNKVLMNHIRDCLPELKAKINKMASEAQAELLTYGDPMYEGKNSQGALLLQIITKFSSDFRNAIEGKSSELALHELYGGARINYIFNDIFARCLMHINPNDGMSMNDIRTAIRNATGPRAALFVPEESFELLVKRQIRRLEEPSLQCVELVYDELQRIITQLENKELLRFVNLRERVVEVINQLFQKCRSPTKGMINNLISIELSYINTNHPDFVGGGGAISSVFQRMAQTHAMDQQMQAQMQMQQQQQQQHMMMMQAQPQPQQMPQPQPPMGGQPQPPQSMPAGQPPKEKKSRKAHRQGQPSAGPGQPSSGFFNMFFGNGPAPNSPDASGFGTAAPSPARPVPQPPKRVATSTSSQSKKLPPTPYDGAPGADKLDQVPATIKAIAAPTEKEKFETELIQSLLVSYFDIVRKNVQDSVPKTIMHFLVNQAKETMQNELVAHLYKEELFDELLEESPAIASRRAACKAMLDVLRRAQAILNEVRDTALH